MDRLGLGYDALRSENPRIICCAITGYGQHGPKAAGRRARSQLHRRDRDARRSRRRRRRAGDTARADRRHRAAAPIRRSSTSCSRCAASADRRRAASSTSRWPTTCSRCCTGRSATARRPAAGRARAASSSPAARPATSIYRTARRPLPRGGAARAALLGPLLRADRPRGAPSRRRARSGGDACLRRDVGTNTQRGRRSAPGRLVSCLEGPSPGGPVRSLRPVILARPPAARFALVLSLCSPDDRNWSGSQSPDRDTNRRTRVPEGNPRDREVPWRARPGSRGGLTASWADDTALRLSEYGTRVPSLICADTRGLRTSGRNGAVAERMAGAEVCFACLRHDRGPSSLRSLNGVYADGSLEAARIAAMAGIEGGASALLMFPPNDQLGHPPEMVVDPFHTHRRRDRPADDPVPVPGRDRFVHPNDMLVRLSREYSLHRRHQGCVRRSRPTRVHMRKLQNRTVRSMCSPLTVRGSSARW